MAGGASNIGSDVRWLAVEKPGGTFCVAFVHGIGGWLERCGRCMKDAKKKNADGVGREFQIVLWIPDSAGKFQSVFSCLCPFDEVTSFTIRLDS